MNERGVTLLESLIALVVGSVVLLGVGSFYVATSRSSSQDSAQTFLQRQGVLTMEEMARQIRPATSLADNCNGGNSLQAINASGAAWGNGKPPHGLSSPADGQQFCGKCGRECSHRQLSASG